MKNERRLRTLWAAFFLLLFVPHPACADDSIDPSLIPDGSYPAHVDKVINAQHIAVTMQGRLKVFLVSGTRERYFYGQDQSK